MTDYIIFTVVLAPVCNPLTVTVPPEDYFNILQLNPNLSLERSKTPKYIFYLDMHMTLIL